VEGVSVHKFDEFGETFLAEIRQFTRKPSGSGTSAKGSTYLHTFALCEQGCSPEEMARQRDLSLSTIHAHLAWLVENGYPVPWQTYLHPVELQTIAEAIARAEAPSAKSLFDHFGGKYSYLQIKLAQALYNRNASASGSA
jgi:ATP-dependent DNA helicase RecQ